MLFWFVLILILLSEIFNWFFKNKNFIKYDTNINEKTDNDNDQMTNDENDNQPLDWGIEIWLK